MKKFIIAASDRRKYLVIADSEGDAKISFSQNFPSLKIRKIVATDEYIFNIID